MKFNSFDELPPQLPNGHVSMGDPSSSGFADAIAEAYQSPSSPEPIQWEQVEIGHDKFKYRPVLTIPNIATFHGEWRKTKQFFKEEREMFTLAFANAISEYLFGQDMFLERPKPFGMSFIPNPKFAKLPAVSPPISANDLRKQKELEKTVERNRAEKNQTLIPLVITDDDDNIVEQIIVSECSPPNDFMDGLPRELVLSRLNEDLDPTRIAKYTQSDM